MDEKTLSELLECSICFFRLKTDSRVLPCQHTFCYDCLVQVASRSSSKLQCPECRQYTHIKVEDLPKNVLLIRLLENMKKSNSPTPATSVSAQTSADTSPKQKESSQTKEEIILVPYAKALFDFNGGTKEQLSFKKGDSILLQKKIDQIWYFGQIHNRAGIFPINHVQVVIPLPGPQCKALYDFKMGPNEEEGCLTFRKGAIIDMIRRVDTNWAEGKIGERIGIFPLSFVELNPEGHKLMSEATTGVINGEMKAVPANVVPVTSKSPVNVNTQSQSQEPPRNIPRSVPTSSTQATHSTTISNMKPADQLANKINVIHPEDSRYQGRYVALYPYKPQRKDELELKKGSHYYISEKCQDGWCKGYSAENPFVTGMFPGNYVMPIIMFQLMMTRRAAPNPSSQQPQQQSQQNHVSPVSANHQAYQANAACYTNPIVMFNPPELPPRNNNNNNNNVNRAMPVSPPIVSPVKPNGGEPKQKKEETPRIQEKQKKETMGDMFRKQWSRYNKKSHPGESGEDVVDGSYSMDNPVFEDLPSPQHQPPAATQKPLNRNLSIEQVKPIHMRSGSCPSQLQNSLISDVTSSAPRAEENSKKTNDVRHQQQSGLVRTNNGFPQSPSNPTSTTNGNGNKRHSGNGNSPGLPFGGTPAMTDPKISHRKANSLDLDALEVMTPKNNHKSKGIDGKSSGGHSSNSPKEKFRCVAPYPPNSRIELELNIGDIIHVYRKRENGWYKGQNQRTGLSGIFPASFVEPCHEPIILDI